MDTTVIRATRKLVRADGSGLPAFEAAAFEFADTYREAALDTCAKLYSARAKTLAGIPRPFELGDVISNLAWALERPDHTPERRLSAMALALAAIPSADCGAMTEEEQYVSTHVAVERSIQAKRQYDAELMWLISESERREKSRARINGLIAIVSILFLTWLVWNSIK